MKMQYEVTNLEFLMKNSTYPFAPEGFGIGESFFGSRCRFSFWLIDYKEPRLFVVPAVEDRAFARLIYDAMQPVRYFADLHTRESGCRNLVHAVLHGLAEHVETQKCAPYHEQPAYCIFNGCVQDSLGHVVPLRNSSPETSLIQGTIR